jgi:hypothetical protein
MWQISSQDYSQFFLIILPTTFGPLRAIQIIQNLESSI